MLVFIYFAIPIGIFLFGKVMDAADKADRERAKDIFKHD